jgi:tetratricopeptide (TPR) repeat protein
MPTKMPRSVDSSELDPMTFCKWSLLLFASLLLAGTAWGKDLDRRGDAARAACLSGDYGKGVAILSELFVETKEADLIYNQGRCFEQNHRYEDAIARFQEFLRVGKKLSKADKADAQKHIADCRNLLEKQLPATALLTDLYLDTKEPDAPVQPGPLL